MHVHPLEKVVVETGENPDASLIWLHGLGADGHDFEPIVPQLGLRQDLRLRFVFPNAPAIPVSINGGYIMPAWYDIRPTAHGLEHDKEGILRSARQIQLLIEQQEMHDIRPQRIILAGFSQGAAMALYCGLRQPRPLAGIIALSGYLLRPKHLQEEIRPEARATPIFLAHGKEDPVVPFDLGVLTRRRLAEAGCRVEWHAYPVGHRVCDEEIRDLGRWINAILAGPA